MKPAAQFVLAIAIVLQIACISSTEPITNKNQNDSVETGDGVVDAAIEFPQPSTEIGDDLKLVAIAEVGGIVGAVFGSSDGTTPTVSRVESETSSEDWSAEFDEDGLPTTVIVEDSQLELGYNDDGTVNYVLRGEDGIVASGFSVERSQTKSAILSKITTGDIELCAQALISDAADDIELASCLLGRDEVRRLAEVVCSSELVLEPALSDAVSGCNGEEDDAECASVAELALVAVTTLLDVARVSVEDFVGQVQAQATDDCASFVPDGIIGPFAYTSAASSPFDQSGLNDTFFLEDFEDLELTPAGVTASAGTPIAPGGITDSVDGDDGALDGSGTGGASFFSGAGAAGIMFSFDEAVIELPTRVGIVWTDGGGAVTFEAFDENGESLGSIVNSAIPDSSIGGTTGEDHFFGAINPQGISAILISNSGGGIEVDHLQFGY